MLDPGIIGVFIPIVAILVGGAIAITRMFTAHQKEMAEMMRVHSDQPALVDELRAMRAEMVVLRDRVNQQTLMMESTDRRTTSTAEVPQRLSEQ